MKLAAGLLAFAGLLILASSSAMAQGYGGSYQGSGYGNYSGARQYGFHSSGYRNRYNGPIYHAPSVHYDRVYHPEYQHWTPGRGLHTHGHYDLVPHYTPGHYDYKHRGHVHGNPHYHD